MKMAYYHEHHLSGIKNTLKTHPRINLVHTHLLHCESKGQTTEQAKLLTLIFYDSFCVNNKYGQTCCVPVMIHLLGIQHRISKLN